MAEVCGPARPKKSVTISAPDAVDGHPKQNQHEDHSDNPAAKGKRLLVAMDESQESIKALRFGLETVVQPGDSVVLLHSQPLPQSYVGPGGPGFYITTDLVAATKKHQENVSKVVLDKAKRICDEANVKSELVISTGDPRDSICDAVEKTGADMLVMGSRGHGAIKRTFLGSVSDYCAHNAKCPVLIVK